MRGVKWFRIASQAQLRGITLNTTIARIKDSRISISGLPERQAIEHQAINASSYGVQSGSVYLFVYYVTRMALDPAFYFFVNPASIMYADYQ